jgi:hypothetical protein
LHGGLLPEQDVATYANHQAFGENSANSATGYDSSSTFNAGFDAGFSQNTSSFFGPSFELSQPAYGVPLGTAFFPEPGHCAPLVGQHPSLPDELSFQGTLGTAASSVPALQQSDSVLGTGTRRPHKKRALTSKASQKKGSIVCPKPGCETLLGRKYDLPRHLETKHPDGEPFRCVRASCTFTTYRLDKFREHLQGQHLFRLEKVKGARTADAEDGEEE